MSLPLYEGAEKPMGKCPADAHAGLWFQRFFDRYEGDAWNIPKAEGKTAWIDAVAQRKHGNRDALKAALQRQESLLAALGGCSRDFRSDWRFVTGLGLSHPVENGFLWHHTLSVPYLPGSAVKGLVRAWIAQWAGGLDEDARKQRLLDWFGSDDSGDSKRFRAGGFIFFDALPLEPVHLVRDVMTPHAGKWYEKGGAISDPQQEPESVPADWHDPIPIPFLVADRPKLRFAIAPRDPARKAELEEVRQALIDALDWLGAGAKTATGYGHMCPLAEDAPSLTPQKKVWQQAKVTYSPGGGRITAQHGKQQAAGEMNHLREVLGPAVLDKLKKRKGKGFQATVVVEEKGNMILLQDIQLETEGQS
ncbi:type III-B CRISPR module RAMP protein Cmr6 [Ectothiorhodospira haloalkaliphila]|uniref:type III-B CRISPR module RAMP protein Cmr6 n=1 Tax=Ectothiorhodospira haloalkaliphila TaxID=421628 RepID=UPI001EE8DBF1|nr:type III-B CRISPR module RAMP protein Cmr6 [Ectothiorhodospira haloalkaliphila]MCG5525868.1 type III-B CRISPR module RAMP protein Cmr6 [Ectothiorhodospira haloalkaliphila]